MIQFAGQGPVQRPGQFPTGRAKKRRVANRYFALEILSVDGTAVERTNGDVFLFTCLDGSLGLEDDLSGTYLALAGGFGAGPRMC